MKEFGQSCYQHTVYFNFDEEDELKSIFGTNKNPQRIIELLSLIAGEKILPGETKGGEESPFPRSSGTSPGVSRSTPYVSPSGGTARMGNHKSAALPGAENKGLTLTDKRLPFGDGKSIDIIHSVAL